MFQRTPSTVAVRGNRPTDESFVQEYLSEEGWQQRRMENFIQMTQTPAIGVEDLINDGWTYMLKNLVNKFLHMRDGSKDVNFRKEVSRLMELADFEEMEKIRGRVDEVVKDNATAAALKPYYRYLCKRPCFHDEYLDTFNRPNVHLVDTDGKGIEGVTSKGVVANGEEYELDCIILATGFEVAFNAGKDGPDRIGYDPTGRNGLKLSEKWKDGPKTFMSFCSRDFPNLLMLNSPQGVVTTNFVHQFDEASKHHSYIVAKCLQDGIRCFEPKQALEESWCRAVYDRSLAGKRYSAACIPGYYNREGTLKVEKSLSGQAPYSPLRFFAILKEKREQGTVFDDLETRR